MIRLAQALLSWAFPLAAAGRGLYRHIMRPITVGVRALIVDDRQVLLVRQHGRAHWVLPGGAAERGETLREAAIREAREETGCEVAAERLLGMYSTRDQGMTNHVAVYVCRALSPPRPRLNIEIAEARYWPIDALPPSAHNMVRRRLAEYAAGAQGLDGSL